MCDIDWLVAAPHIQDEPAANETAYRPTEDARLPCVADSDPELVTLLSFIYLKFSTDIHKKLNIITQQHAKTI